MSIHRSEWPLVRQLTGHDPTARGAASCSRWSKDLARRTADADRVVQSICPFCAVGCGQRIFVKDDWIIRIEGDPDSPISSTHTGVLVADTATPAWHEARRELPLLFAASAVASAGAATTVLATICGDAEPSSARIGVRTACRASRRNRFRE